jgi:glycosyltransferase involved in cell wall biosynthesis
MVSSWRKIFEARYGLSPLIFMVQAFGSDDPNEYGFDGAIEFPPHKLQHRAVPANSEMTIYDTSMSGLIFRYRDFIAASLSFKRSPFPLIRTIFPSWDNDARRQGHGMSTTGSTPALYRFWLDKMIRFAGRNRVFGETMVFINAWNEWAEGTYLEPDLHFGGAYLNETARAAIGQRQSHLKRKVLLVGHDAHPHGAQELLLNIGEMLKREFGCEIEFLLCGDGPLLERYEALAPTRLVTQASISKVLSELSDRDYSDAIVNSLASGWVVEPLRNHFFKVITLVHELPELIRAYKLDRVARAVAESANEIVFPSSVVLDGFRSIVGEAAFESTVRPQGLYKRLESSPHDRDDFRRELGLGQDTKIVVNVGYGDQRKGIDIFADVARRFAADAPEVHFVWAGLTDQPTVEALGTLLDLPNLHWLGQRSDVGRLLAAADVFALTSREDPFPSVVLEAMASGLPVVAFEGAGGFVDLFDSPDAGTLVPLADGEAMADAIRAELARPTAERQLATDRRKMNIAQNFSFRDYVFWLLQRLDPELLRVSVVVPNYNYRRYLDQRLGSIFAQTYPVYEIIVLDDASTDGSIDEVEQVTAATGRGVRVVANEKNSGNVFRQWRKGVELVSGDLVWIAEADDASEPQFLATLARKFEGSQVDLAFTDSRSIDADGNHLSSSYQYYYSTVERESLAHSFAIDGTEFAERFMSERNLILNASSTVWRASSLTKALAEEEPDVTEFTVAGDWLLYLRVCGMGGQVGYHSRPLNIHRRAQGVTARTRGDTQLREIERLYQNYDRMFPVTDAVRSKRAAYLSELRRQFADAS